MPGRDVPTAVVAGCLVSLGVSWIADRYSLSSYETLGIEYIFMIVEFVKAVY